MLCGAWREGSASPEPREMRFPRGHVRQRADGAVRAIVRDPRRRAVAWRIRRRCGRRGRRLHRVGQRAAVVRSRARNVGADALMRRAVARIVRRRRERLRRRLNRARGRLRAGGAGWNDRRSGRPVAAARGENGCSNERRDETRRELNSHVITPNGPRDVCFRRACTPAERRFAGASYRVRRPLFIGLQQFVTSCCACALGLHADATGPRTGSVRLAAVSRRSHPAKQFSCGTAA